MPFAPQVDMILRTSVQKFDLDGEPVAMQTGRPQFKAAIANSIAQYGHRIA
jgi:hypothetical protein